MKQLLAAALIAIVVIFGLSIPSNGTQAHTTTTEPPLAWPSPTYMPPSSTTTTTSVAPVATTAPSAPKPATLNTTG